MSDIPTDATGVHVVGNHAYLYNRNGTYIADAALAGEVLAAFELTPDDAKLLAASWLGTIGYAITGEAWTEHHGWLRAVEYVGVADYEPASVDGPPPSGLRRHRARIADASRGWTAEWFAASGTHKYVSPTGAQVYVDFDRSDQVTTAKLYRGTTEDSLIARVSAGSRADRLEVVVGWFAQYGHVARSTR